MKEFLKDLLRQLFGLQKPREGKVELTRRAVTEMLNNGLYPELIEQAFRTGIEVRSGVIVKKFQKYIVGIYYKYDITEEVYKVLFCYKN